MATSMNYSVVARKNPSKKDEPSKYYALAQASGELDFDEMCEAITGRTTCTETDVRAALAGIIYEAKRALKAGRIVRLGDLGSLQMGLSSKGGGKSGRLYCVYDQEVTSELSPGQGIDGYCQDDGVYPCADPEFAGFGFGRQWFGGRRLRQWGRRN